MVPEVLDPVQGFRGVPRQSERTHIGAGGLKRGLGEARIEGGAVVEHEHDAFARLLRPPHEPLEQWEEERCGGTLVLVGEEELPSGEADGAADGDAEIAARRRYPSTASSSAPHRGGDRQQLESGRVGVPQFEVRFRPAGRTLQQPQAPSGALFSPPDQPSAGS